MRGIEYNVAPVIWSGVFWLLAAIAIGVAAYLSMRLLADRKPAGLVEPPAPAPGPHVPPAPQARAILDERLAKGEIEIDEYKSRLEVLDQ